MKPPTELRFWPRLLTYGALVLLSLVFMLPFLWLVSTSLKGDAQIMKYPPDLIPNPLVLKNYREGLQAAPFGLYLLNTLGIATAVIAGTMVSCSLVAYSFAILRWPRRDLVFFLMLSTMMLPGQVTMIPLFMVFRKLGWVNTFLPLIVPAFFGNAFFIFLLRQFFLTIPRDLIDAARIDGCSEFRLWWQIVLPLSKPALATVGLFTFLGAWNDFLGPLIYLVDQGKYTLSLGLAMFRGQYGSQFGQLMAVSTLMILPVIVLFFFTQKTFIQGIKTSGLKG
jgi:multiple sugar transport system permease protein